MDIVAQVATVVNATFAVIAAAITLRHNHKGQDKVSSRRKAAGVFSSAAAWFFVQGSSKRSE